MVALTCSKDNRGPEMDQVYIHKDYYEIGSVAAAGSAAAAVVGVGVADIGTLNLVHRNQIVAGDLFQVQGNFS